MKLVTIMDYCDSNYVSMCKIWIYLARRFNPEAEIYIFSQNDIDEIQNFALRFNKIYFRKLPLLSFLQRSQVKGKVDKTCHDVKLALWPAIEQCRLRKFIYVDADAFILNTLSPWWKIIDSKPFIAVPERIINRKILYNAGVFSYSSSNNFITLQKLKKQYEIDHNKIVLPSSDQGLLNSYFRRINYIAHLQQIDYSYNCMAKNCKVEDASDNKIQITTGNYAGFERYGRRLLGIQEDWWEGWLGWNKKLQVNILHSFGGKGFKFWELKECQALWNYCVSKVNLYST